MRATAPGCLLLGASQAIGKHVRDRRAGASVTPEFMPKQNSALIGTASGRFSDGGASRDWRKAGAQGRAGRDSHCC